MLRAFERSLTLHPSTLAHSAPMPCPLCGPSVMRRKASLPALHSLHLVSCKTGDGLPQLLKQMQELMAYRWVCPRPPQPCTQVDC